MPYALGSSRSSWYFEALLDRSARERDERAFDVAFEAEAALPVPPDIDNEFPVLRWKSEDYVPPEK